MNGTAFVDHSEREGEPGEHGKIPKPPDYLSDTQHPHHPTPGIVGGWRQQFTLVPHDTKLLECRPVICPSVTETVWRDGKHSSEPGESAFGCLASVLSTVLVSVLKGPRVSLHYHSSETMCGTSGM